MPAKVTTDAQEKKIRQLIDGSIDCSFTPKGAKAAKQVVADYFFSLKAENIELKKQLKRVEAVQHDKNKSLEANFAKAKKRVNNQLKTIRLAISLYGKGEILIADGTPVKLGEEYFGNDGRKWKVVNLDSPNWLRVKGVDLKGEPVKISVNREWLTVEPPSVSDKPIA